MHYLLHLVLAATTASAMAAQSAPIASVQLAEIGLTPDSIRYVALSHLHLDHCGNIGLFPHATFLMPDREPRSESRVKIRVL